MTARDHAPLEPDQLRVRRGAAVSPAPVVSIIVLVTSRTRHLEACLAALAEHAAPGTAQEVIVLANGTPRHALSAIEARDDIVLIRSDVNHGFGGGCNWSARFARGAYLAFVNDDTVVTAGWLDALLDTMAADPRIAVAGSKVVLMDGRLQEAGSVVWSDGTTYGVGRFDDPQDPRHLVRRDVDYVSFCSALVRREAFDAAGGFDERYFPAYYEDADLCLALQQAGWRTVCEPASVVLHHESASTSLSYRLFLSDRNRRQFAEKWAHRLGRYEQQPTEEQRPAAVVRALRRAGGDRPELLVIDDCEPDPGLGAGFGRMHAAVVELSARYAITFAATYLNADRDNRWLVRRRTATRRALSALGVELRIGDLDWITGDTRRFDAVLISRPTNYIAAEALLDGPLRGVPLVYDTESLWHRRLYRQAELASGDAAARFLDDARRFEAAENRALRRARAVVCISAEEADVARSIRSDDAVVVVPVDLVDAVPTSAPFEGRMAELLFAASWIAGRDSPNIAALEWMAASVMPLVRAAVPWARLVVTGADPPAAVSALEGPSLTAVGFVPDIGALYRRVRVVACPMLAGAGVKLKTVEALLSGVPTVSTSVGAEGIVPVGAAPLVADDADVFAQHCIRLLSDGEYWEHVQRDSLGFAQRERERRGTAGGASWTAVVAAVEQPVTTGGR